MAPTFFIVIYSFKASHSSRVTRCLMLHIGHWNQEIEDFFFVAVEECRTISHHRDGGYAEALMVHLTERYFSAVLHELCPERICLAVNSTVDTILSMQMTTGDFHARKNWVTIVVLDVADISFFLILTRICVVESGLIGQMRYNY